MGDRIAVLKEGAIQQVADPLTVYNSPANLFVAGFMGSPPMNFFRGVVVQNGSELFFVERNGAAEPRPGNFTLRIPQRETARLSNYVGKPLLLGLRPEDMTVRAEKGPGGRHSEPPGNDTVSARIDLIEPVGPEAYLHLATPAHSFIARIRAAEQVRASGTVTMAFDMSKAHFFDPTSELAIA